MIVSLLYCYPVLLRSDLASYQATKITIQFMKIHKGDKVKIITGEDKGKDGVVSKVLRPKPGTRRHLAGKIVVEGVNLYKKHVKPSAKIKEGGIVEIEKPLDASNVMLICPKCNSAARVGFKIEGGKKYRICKKCGEIISLKKVK